MNKLNTFLTQSAEKGFISWQIQCEAAKRFGVSLASVEEAILSAGLMPGRYRRNRSSISIEEQLRLFRSRVAVIGCGGLGGYVIEELARLGVGTLVAVDPDVFEEHNLNRQLLSSPQLLGSSKVEAASRRVQEINPAVSVDTHQVAFSKSNAPELLKGVSAVVDGLDSAVSRRELAEACRTLSLPWVHGAIGGWYGQVSVQMPGEDLTPLLKGAVREDKGLEKKLGNPSFTPAVVASLQVAETCKVLLSRGSVLSGRVLFVNLLDMEFSEVNCRRP